MLKRINKAKLNSFSSIIGVLLILVGVLGGIYIGFWLMFVGGIIQVINVIRVTPLVPMDIVIGVAKIIFCELGVLIPIIGYIVGMALIEKR